MGLRQLKLSDRFCEACDKPIDGKPIQLTSHGPNGEVPIIRLCRECVAELLRGDAGRVV